MTCSNSYMVGLNLISLVRFVLEITGDHGEKALLLENQSLSRYSGQ